MTDVTLLRRHSLWFARLTLLLFSATTCVVAVPTLIGLVVASGRGVPLEPVLWRALVIWSPSIFYLYALWAVHGAFAHFAEGGTFGPAIATGCVRAGIALSIGASLSAIGVTNALRVLHRQGLVDAPPRSFTAFLQFDTAYVAVGVVGLALVLVGQLLHRAADLQSEAAALRDELGGFF